MDRNTVIGLMLIGAILVSYMVWMQPSAAELEAQQRAQDSITNVQAERARKSAERDSLSQVEETAVLKEAAQQPQDSAAMAERDSLERIQRTTKYGTFATAATGEAAYHTIENEFVRLTLSNKGASPVSAELKNYVTFDSLPLYLFDKETSNFDFSFVTKDPGYAEIHSSEMYFEPVPDEMSANKAVYRLYAGSRSQYLEVSYEIPPGESYLVDANIKAVGMDEVMRSSEDIFELHWGIQAPFHERSLEQEQNVSTVYYKFQDGDVDYVSETSYEKEDLDFKVSWVSFKQQFFSAAIISERGFDGESAETGQLDDPKYTKAMALNLEMEFPAERDPNFPFQFYFGPNHYQTLEDLGIGLEEQINLGWTIFGWVNRWLVIPVFNFLDEYTGLSYGIIILILTLLIKLLLFPLTWKNYVSSARMRVLKPEVDEINEKMKDKDPMAKQQAVMGLYRQAGVNPMAGCIPMILQLPILYAMFRFFPASIELRQESFLWATDLSTYDSVINLPFEVPFYGAHVSLFTLLMAISTFFYSKYNMDMAGGGGNAQMPQMKMMIYIMPVFLLAIFNNYAAGLSYYYLSANVISMLQQFVIKRYFIDEDAIHRKIQANKKKPSKKSGFQQRLEKMAKERGMQTPKKK